MSRTEIDEQIIENIVKRTIQMTSEDASASLVRASKLIADTHDFVEKLSQGRHSITQELIDQGAYDVAKNYIDFLKSAQGIPVPSPPNLRNAKAKITTPPPQTSTATATPTDPKGEGAYLGIAKLQAPLVTGVITDPKIAMKHKEKDDDKHA